MRKQWKQVVEGTHRHLCNVLTRKGMEKTYRTSPPGAHNGEYVVIKFGILFANRKSTMKTAFPMMDESSAWWFQAIISSDMEHANTIGRE
ncbi:MAG TPA: DUF4019 domain-containing protein [Syntrophorhabdus sp.]|nr:DUF4019 domain-containing protein [Syntrophorhabdus sp.]